MLTATAAAAVCSDARARVHGKLRMLDARDGSRLARSIELGAFVSHRGARMSAIHGQCSVGQLEAVVSLRRLPALGAVAGGAGGRGGDSKSGGSGGGLWLARQAAAAAAARGRHRGGVGASRRRHGGSSSGDSDGLGSGGGGGGGGAAAAAGGCRCHTNGSGELSPLSCTICQWSVDGGQQRAMAR
jgi:hypothetical protein